MRRFDGHGTSSYRPTNPEAAKQQSSALQALLAERERQNAGLFGQAATATAATATTATVTTVTTVPAPSSQKAPEEESGPCYSLSDATKK